MFVPTEINHFDPAIARDWRPTGRGLYRCFCAACAPDGGRGVFSPAGDDLYRIDRRRTSPADIRWFADQLCQWHSLRWEQVSGVQTSSGVSLYDPGPLDPVEHMRLVDGFTQWAITKPHPGPALTEQQFVQAKTMRKRILERTHGELYRWCKFAFMTRSEPHQRSCW